MTLGDVATALTIFAIGMGFVAGLVRIGTILGSIQSSLKSAEAAMAQQVLATIAVERALTVHVTDENRRFEHIEGLILTARSGKGSTN